MGNQQQKQMLKQQQQQQLYQAQLQQQAEQKKLQEQQKTRQMEIRGQQSVQGLNAQLNKLDDQIRKKEAQSLQLEARAKELITQGKKNDAKNVVAQLKTVQNEIKLFSTRRAVVQKQKNNLEIAAIDINMAGAMGQANNFLKESGNINDKMTDILLDQRELQQQMAQTNDIMGQLAQNQNQAEEDELFKELENEVNTQKAQQISAQLYAGQQQTVKVPTMVQQQQYVQRSQMPQQYQPMVVGKQKPTSHMDDIERMLNS